MQCLALPSIYLLFSLRCGVLPGGFLCADISDDFMCGTDCVYLCRCDVEVRLLQNLSAQSHGLMFVCKLFCMVDHLLHYEASCKAREGFLSFATSISFHGGALVLRVGVYIRLV